MIVFFGPAGAGKSIQGQILAARQNWRWLSAGQILRDARDPEINAYMQEGKLIPSDVSNRIMDEAIRRAGEIDEIILDGFPRQLEQATWLVGTQQANGRNVEIIVVLEVPRQELLKRLSIRGRADDTPEAIDQRLSDYRQVMYPILGYMTEQKIPIVHIDGVGTVGEVHDRIYEELKSRGLVA